MCRNPQYNAADEFVLTYSVFYLDDMRDRNEVAMQCSIIECRLQDLCKTVRRILDRQIEAERENEMR